MSNQRWAGREARQRPKVDTSRSQIQLKVEVIRLDNESPRRERECVSQQPWKWEKEGRAHSLAHRRKRESEREWEREREREREQERERQNEARREGCDRQERQETKVYIRGYTNGVLADSARLAPWLSSSATPRENIMTSLCKRQKSDSRFYSTLVPSLSLSRARALFLSPGRVAPHVFTRISPRPGRDHVAVLETVISLPSALAYRRRLAEPSNVES